MPFIRVESTIDFLGQQDQALSVMHFNVVDTSSTVVDSAVSQVKTFWQGLVSILANTTTVHTGQRVLDVSNPISVMLDEGNPVNVVGTSASSAVPNIAQGLIAWKTASITRAGRGRTYIPGMANSTVAAGNVAAAALNTMNSAANSYPFTADVNGHYPVIFHRATRTGDKLTDGVARAEFSPLRSRR